MFNITEIKRRADIREVWSALGGPKLRGNRGQAFWRNGDGFNIAIDADRNVWYDHAAGEGGDVVALVQVVQGSSFLDAAEWLARFTGTLVSEWIQCERDRDTNWPQDREEAQWWRMCAEALAELALEDLPCFHLERRGLTELLRTIRLGDASLVDEYRAWRRRAPELTAAMVYAGENANARMQSKAASLLMQRERESRA